MTIPLGQEAPPVREYPRATPSRLRHRSSTRLIGGRIAGTELEQFARLTADVVDAAISAALASDGIAARRVLRTAGVQRSAKDLVEGRARNSLTTSRTRTGNLGFVVIKLQFIAEFGRLGDLAATLAWNTASAQTTTAATESRTSDLSEAGLAVAHRLRTMDESLAAPELVTTYRSATAEVREAVHAFIDPAHDARRANQTHGGRRQLAAARTADVAVPPKPQAAQAERQVARPRPRPQPRALLVPVAGTGILSLKTGKLEHGRRVGLAFTSEAQLVAAMGREQRWVRLSESTIRAMLEPLAVTTIQLDPSLVSAAPTRSENPAGADVDVRRLGGATVVSLGSRSSGAATLSQGLAPASPSQVTKGHFHRRRWLGMSAVVAFFSAQLPPNL